MVVGLGVGEKGFSELVCCAIRQKSQAQLPCLFPGPLQAWFSAPSAGGLHPGSLRGPDWRSAVLTTSLAFAELKDEVFSLPRRHTEQDKGEDAGVELSL